jgi:hypothetical protein
MPTYCVDSQPRPNGAHEVHNVDLCRCDRLPLPDLRVDIGYHTSAHPAIERAMKIYPQAVGCRTCCPESQGVPVHETAVARAVSGPRASTGHAPHRTEPKTEVRKARGR